MTAGRALQPAQPGVQSALMTRAHKAAIILAALGPDSAKAIVSEISDAHLRAFAKAFSELKSVPPQLLNAVAREFTNEVERSSAELAGGVAEATRLLSTMTSEERVSRVLADMDGAGGAKAVWTRLEAAEAKAIADYLATQRLPVAAIVLGKLPYEKCAAVLAAAEATFAEAAILELSRKSDPPLEVLDLIAAGVDSEFLAPLAKKPAAGGSPGIVIEIVNCLPPAKRDAFLSHLDKSDPHVGKAVRKSLVIFEDLHRRLPDSAPAILIREIDKETLLKAVKFGRENAPDTVKFLFGAVSKRMVEQYEEEIAAMAVLKPEDGEDAQRTLVGVVRRLVAAGTIKLNPHTDDAA